MARQILQNQLSWAIDRHGEGLLFSVLESLVKCHMVRVEHTPHGHFVKMFGDRHRAPDAEAARGARADVMTRAVMLQHRPCLRRCVADKSSSDLRAVSLSEVESSQHVCVADMSESLPTEPDMEISPGQRKFRHSDLSEAGLSSANVPLMPTFRLLGVRSDENVSQDSDFESCVGDEGAPISKPAPALSPSGSTQDASRKSIKVSKADVREMMSMMRELSASYRGILAKDRDSLDSFNDT